MRLRRITIRGLMCVVIGVGVAVHVPAAAIRVNSAKAPHLHAWVGIGGKPYFTLASFQPPFWPRYWRCLLGLPWENVPVCPRFEGRFLDMCEYRYPEYLKRDDRTGTRFRSVPTQAQLDLKMRLEAELVQKRLLKGE
jgi:hypothetical protein